jgi:hypothetical protein
MWSVVRLYNEVYRLMPAVKEVADYKGKCVLFQPHNSKPALRGGALKQDRGAAATSDKSGGSGRSRHNGTQGPCGLTQIRTADNRSVNSGH